MRFIRQLTVILTICFAAELMEELIPIPVAASIYGLVLMLAGLFTGVIPLEKVEGAADFLVEAMPVFFVPPTVGIMTSAEELRAMLIPLTVISAVTTLLIMAVTGRVSQSILRRERAAGDGGAPRPEQGRPAGEGAGLPAQEGPAGEGAGLPAQEGSAGEGEYIPAQEGTVGKGGAEG